MTTRLFYARAVLWACGQRANAPEIEQALVAVMTGEDSTAHWNPMDTTLDVSGATDYNPTGVKNYPSCTLGVMATVGTLQLPYYVTLMQAIRYPSVITALQWCRLFSRTPWGGIGDLLPFEIVQEYNAGTRDYTHDRDLPVSGAGPWLYQSNGEPMTFTQPAKREDT